LYYIVIQEMVIYKKVQCDYKQIDEFITEDGTTIIVWLLKNKRSIKIYCEDTGMEYKEGLKRLYARRQ